MNPSSDNDAPKPEPLPGGTPGSTGTKPSNWREALVTLIESRIALIQFESKGAARDVARRGVSLIGLLICIFYTWGLLLAAGIAAVSAASGWPWYKIAFCAAGIHAVAALIFALSAKSKAAPPFPITRAEFQKDREWIENLQKPRKSNV